MGIWEYRIYTSRSFFGPRRVKDIWEKPNKDGLSDWDVVIQSGAEGWELVSAVPITDFFGGTARLAFVFKRAGTDTPATAITQT